MRLQPIQERILAVIKHASHPLGSDEIAERVGCARGAVKVHVHYIRSELRKEGADISSAAPKPGYRYVEREA